MKKPLPLLATLFVIAVATLGCQTVKEARKAQRGNQQLPGEQTLLLAETSLTNLTAVTLTQLENIASSNQPAILQARQAVASARLQCVMIRSSRLPQISAGGTYQRSTQNTSARDTDTRMRGSWSGSLGLDLLLHDFGRLNARERQAIAAWVAAQEQLREIELQVCYAVRSAFFEYHRSDELLRVAQESEKQYAQHLEEARTMLEVGTRRQYDVTKAEVDFGNAKLDIITASNTLVTARAELNRSIGLAENTFFQIGTGQMPSREESPDTLMLIARANAPTLAVLHAQVRSASSYVDETIAELYPELSLSANTDLSGQGFPFVWNFSWATRLIQNIFDGHRKTAQIEEAVTQLRSARSRVAEEEQVLYRDLVDSVAHYRSAVKRLEIAQLVERQTHENLAIVNEQYRVGISSSIERTDAQVMVTQAQADVVRARYDRELASALIDQLTGSPIHRD